MITFPILDSEGRTFAFEIESIYIGIGKISSLLHSLTNVSDIHARKLFSGAADVHITFRYKEREFMVWEPYADSSRYWIGPRNESDEKIDIAELLQMFQQYQAAPIVRMVGDLLTLKFLKKQA